MCVQKVRTLLLFMLVSVCISSCIKDETLRGSEDIVFPGDTLPEFSVIMNDGRVISDNDLKGNVSVIVFFHTQCPDCRKELPVMQNIYDKFMEYDDFVMIAISREESEESVSHYWNENGIDIPYSAQENRSVYELFSTRGVPRVYISDRDGVISYVHSDIDMPSFAVLAEEIEGLI